MAATDAQIKTLVRLDREFKAVFGERIPGMELPHDPAARIRIVRECIEQRSMEPIQRLRPPGSYT